MTTIGIQLQTNALVAYGPCRSISENESPVAVVRISADGGLVAYGDDSGMVTIAAVAGGKLGRRVKIADAGAAIRDLAWHPTLHQTLVIASSNGFVNTLHFVQPGSELKGYSGKHLEKNTAVKVKGFITCITFSDSGETLAIGYDTKVIIVPFPFAGGQWGRDAVGAFLPFHLFPGCPYAPDSELKSLPIKYRPIPRQVHFLSDGSVIVTFLAGIMYVFELNEPYEILTDVNVVSAFEIDISGKWKYSWRLSSSGDCMASTAISPSKTVLAATNLISGIDWYSITARRFQMSTHSSMRSPTNNYILEVAFLDESTVAVGSNVGKVGIAHAGNSHYVHELGTIGDYPIQSISIARAISTSLWFVAASNGDRMELWTLTRKGGIESQVTIPNIVNIDQQAPDTKNNRVVKMWAWRAWRLFLNHPIVTLSVICAIYAYLYWNVGRSKTQEFRHADSTIGIIAPMANDGQYHTLEALESTFRSAPSPHLSFTPSIYTEEPQNPAIGMAKLSISASQPDLVQQGEDTDNEDLEDLDDEEVDEGLDIEGLDDVRGDLVDEHQLDGPQGEKGGNLEGSPLVITQTKLITLSITKTITETLTTTRFSTITSTSTITAKRKTKSRTATRLSPSI